MVYKDEDHPLYELMIDIIGDTRFNLNFEHKEYMLEDMNGIIDTLEEKVI